MRIIWFIGLSLALILSGCKETETPAFLHIEAIDLKVRPGFEQGTNDHGIVDARVYLNDDLLGIYEMPATIPIISEGPQSINIIAGIKNNGIQTARIDYPFYDQYKSTLNLLPGDTIDFSDDTENTKVINGYHCPRIEYFYPGLEFWNERFEEPGSQFEATEDSNADIFITQDPVKVFNYDPGNSSQGSGRIFLNADEPYFEIRSNHNFSPIKGQKVYLELNYKSEAVLQVGVYENSPVETKVYGKGIYPNQEWSKIYIELTGEVAGRANASSYSLFIEGERPSGISEAEVLIDNIKLVYPQ